MNDDGSVSAPELVSKKSKRCYVHCTFVALQAVRACPVCRQVTHYVTPSMVWPADEEEKEAIQSAYKTKLASIDCRFFSHGSGTCPFSTSCMYRHAYRNGQLEVQLHALPVSTIVSALLSKDVSRAHWP